MRITLRCIFQKQQHLLIYIRRHVSRDFPESSGNQSSYTHHQRLSTVLTSAKTPAQRPTKHPQSQHILRLCFLCQQRAKLGPQGISCCKVEGSPCPRIRNLLHKYVQEFSSCQINDPSAIPSLHSSTFGTQYLRQTVCVSRSPIPGMCGYSQQSATRSEIGGLERNYNESAKKCCHCRSPGILLRVLMEKNFICINQV